MLPQIKLEEDQRPGFTGLSVQQLTDWRNDQLSWIQWRYSASVEAEYKDGNQFDDEDAAQMAQNGIPMTTINRISHQINSVIGLQESNVTDLKLTAEDVGQQDVVDALNVKLHGAERTSKLRRARLDAAKSAATVGIGWIELGRSSNPFRPQIKAHSCNWRELYWDWNADSLEDMSNIRRVRFYRMDQLCAAFKDMSAAIEATSWSADNIRMFIEPDRMQRDYQKRNWRDFPLSWNQGYPSRKDTRLLEEVWYQVQLEGPIVRLPGGRVMTYEDSAKNPMVELAIKTGLAEVEIAPYSRWRRSYWINDLRLRDEWSPLPFEDCPYTPIWCYREDMTGVPYGLVRVMRSLQDAINTMEGKILFSLNAKQVQFEEGAIDPTVWGQQINRKNALLPIKQGWWNKVKVDNHTEINAQQFSLYEDLQKQIDTVSGISGLNPSAMGSGRPRSGVLAEQMMMQAMSAIGEFSANCREAALRTGNQLVEMVREDIAKKGNVQVHVKHKSGRRSNVVLHADAGQHEGGKVISNDVTLLNAELALEEVPHTPTYRAAQLDNLAVALQSLPTNDPSTLKVRLILTAKMLECSDIPGGAEDAQIIRESIGLAPPETPEEAAAQQAQQQDAQQQKELSLAEATAVIRKHHAQAGKLEADAQLKLAQAQKEAQPDPFEQAGKVVQLRKQAAQVDQIHGKVAHSQAATTLTSQKALQVARENAAPKKPPENW